MSEADVLTGKAAADRFQQMVAAEQARIDGKPAPAIPAKVAQAENGGVLTGPAAHARFAELVAQQSGQATANDRIAEFDREMQKAGLQSAPASAETIAPDARCMEYLQNLRRENPNFTPAQVAIWERDVASVLQGRVWGESPAAFEARLRTGAAAPALAADLPSTEAPAIVPPEVAAIMPAEAELDSPDSIAAVLKVGASVGVNAETVGAILAEAAETIDRPGSLPEALTDAPFNMFEYVIDPSAIGEGFRIDRNSRELYAVCKAARQRGISQQALGSMMKSYFL